MIYEEICKAYHVKLILISKHNELLSPINDENEDYGKLNEIEHLTNNQNISKLFFPLLLMNFHICIFFLFEILGKKKYFLYFQFLLYNKFNVKTIYNKYKNILIYEKF